VERIRARGNVHRTFIGFEVEGEPPQPGTKVRANEKDMGEITSATRLPNGHIVAVGYLRREIAGPGTAVQIGEQSATVHNLPFEF
jgi:aminomethyltransferase